MKNNSNVIVSIYRGDKINKYYWIFGNTEYGLQYWNTCDAEKIQIHKHEEKINCEIMPNDKEYG